MKFTTMKQAAQFRITEKEDNYWIEDYWKAAIEIFTKDCAKTMKFFQNDCTDEEFYWLSEIFEEIAEKTKSDVIQVIGTKFILYRKNQQDPKIVLPKSKKKS